jgi:peptide/nickel transport system substrate-binding protein
LRRAIAWAINRQELVDHVYQDIGVVAKGPISPASWAYDKSFSGISYDVNQAKSELSQAGASGKVSFTLSFTAGVPVILQAAQFIQAQLQAVGTTMNLKQEIFSTLITDWQTSNYQMAFFGFTGATDPDPLIYTLFTTHGGFNHSHYSDPVVDASLESARRTLDQAQRSADYAKAQQLIVQDAPLIFIYHPAVYQATSKRLQNYQLLPSTFVDFTSVYLS